MIVETPEKQWTVYAHVFPNGKMYVGMTSLRPWERWGYGHKYKFQPVLWSDIQKYGWKNIKHEIIASGLIKEDAESLEKTLIQELNLTNPELGYNIAIGKEPSTDTKQRLSDSVHRFYETHDAPPNPRLGIGGLQFMSHKRNDSYKGGKEKSPKSFRRVRCVDTGIEYSSVVEAAESTGIKAAHIYSNALGARLNAGGMQWEYLDAPHQTQHTRSEQYKENKRGIKNGRAKPIRCVETGEVFGTCKELADHLNINKGLVSNFMRRDQTHIGLHYEYVDKGEMTNGTIFSESQERTGTD